MSRADICPTLRELSVEELTHTANSLFANDRFAEAAALLGYVLAFRNRSLPVWLGLLRCHEAQGDLAAAGHVLCAAAFHGSIPECPTPAPHPGGVR